MSQEVPEREGSVSSVTTVSATTAIHVPAGDGTDHPPILKSSSESLRQISLQLSGLVMGSEAAGKENFVYTLRFSCKSKSLMGGDLGFMRLCGPICVGEQ